MFLQIELGQYYIDISAIKSAAGQSWVETGVMFAETPRASQGPSKWSHVFSIWDHIIVSYDYRESYLSTQCFHFTLTWWQITHRFYALIPQQQHCRNPTKGLSLVHRSQLILHAEGEHNAVYRFWTCKLICKNAMAMAGCVFGSWERRFPRSLQSVQWNFKLWI